MVPGLTRLLQNVCLAGNVGGFIENGACERIIAKNIQVFGRVMFFPFRVVVHDNVSIACEVKTNLVSVCVVRRAARGTRHDARSTNFVTLRGMGFGSWSGFWFGV